MKKFLLKFSPLLVSLLAGVFATLVVGEILILILFGIVFKGFLLQISVGYALGICISCGRLVHTHWDLRGTVFNEEPVEVKVYNARSYAVRSMFTMVAWVCIFYFGGQECVLASMVGTIISSKLAVYCQPVIEKYISRIL